MFEIIESATYKAWFSELRDIHVRAHIDARIRRLSLGNPGHHRVLKGGIAELEVEVGPGFRVYYAARPHAHHPAVRRRQIDATGRYPQGASYR